MPSSSVVMSLLCTLKPHAPESGGTPSPLSKQTQNYPPTHRVGVIHIFWLRDIQIEALEGEQK